MTRSRDEPRPLDSRPPDPIPLDASVEARLTAAVERFGEHGVVERSVALLSGANVGDEFLLWVGGRHAEGVLNGAPPLYWPEVWGARALLHVWEESATSAVLGGLGDVAWRVREMCARVVAVRALPHPEDVAALLSDDVARVRAAGARALAEVGRADQLDALRALFSDPDIDVRRRAGEAVTRVTERENRSGA